MNATLSIATMAPPPSGGRRLAVKILGALLLLSGWAGAAFAIEQPPQTPSQQRAWLLSHLVTDMQSVGSFASDDIARMTTLINALDDQQVGLLTQFYYLTREKAEQDASLYAAQQSESADALAQAQAVVADVLVQLQNQIQQTYSELAATGPTCQTLCQFTYASVPGWCAYNQYAIPESYYSNGCYVGPVYSAAYCGPYAVPVYNVFYNRHSHYNWWSSRTFLHNNIVRIGHPLPYRGIGGVVGGVHPRTIVPPSPVVPLNRQGRPVTVVPRVHPALAGHGHVNVAGRHLGHTVATHSHANHHPAPAAHIAHARAPGHPAAHHAVRTGHAAHASHASSAHHGGGGAHGGKRH